MYIRHTRSSIYIATYLKIAYNEYAQLTELFHVIEDSSYDEKIHIKYLHD